MNSFIFFFILMVLGQGQSEAREIVAFGPKNMEITGSIPYGMVGKYRAHFAVFNGRIALDQISGDVQSVSLDIEAASIRSNCPWCDKAVRSRKLLNTARYPRIVFKSDKIWKILGQYKVLGVLEMHGVKKKIGFPFKVKIYQQAKSGRKCLELKGKWVLNRKDFKINWNKYLDHGGVLVGDYFTVEWGIRFCLN